MALLAGSNGNSNASTSVGILNEVWDEASLALRTVSGYGPVASKTVTYTAAANANGDFDGSGNPLNLFLVSGQVLCAVIAVCGTTLTGAAGTISVGVAGSTARFIPVTTGTTITAGRTVDITGLVAAGTAPVTTPNQAATDTQTIIGTVGTADITAGVLTYYCFYKPLSAGATVTAL